MGTVYCVGLAYDYCVGATARDAALNGFKTFLVKDATRGIMQHSILSMEKEL